MKNVRVGLDITGHVRVEKWSKSRDERLDLEFDNVVLNIGWDTFATQYITPITSGGLFPRYLYLGTGATEPKATDLGLAAVSTALGGKYMHSWPELGGVFSVSEKYSTVNLRFDYGEGEAEGVWTELGLGYRAAYNPPEVNAPYTTPFNRALFRDETGTPIAITVLADEYLRVFVQLRLHVRDLENTTLNWNFNGEPVTSQAVLSNSAIANTPSFGSGNLWTNFPRFSTWWHQVPPCSSIGSSGSFLTATHDEANLSSTFVFNKTSVGSAVGVEDISFQVNVNRPFLTIEHNIPVRAPFTCSDNNVICCLDTETMTGSWGISFFRACLVGSSGTATGGSSVTLVDSTKTWTTNEFQFRRVRIVGGTGEGQIRRIASNTADTITVELDWDTAPDATSEYEVCLNG